MTAPSSPLCSLSQSWVQILSCLKAQVCYTCTFWMPLSCSWVWWALPGTDCFKWTACETEHLGWQGSPQHPQCGRQQNPCPRAKHTAVGTCCSTSTAPALSRRGFKVPLHFPSMKVPPLIDCTSLAISCFTESSSLKSRCLSTGGQENEEAIRASPAPAHLHGC